MKTNFTSTLPSGLPRQTYINGVARDAEVGEPADDINDIVARVLEISNNLPNSAADVNAAPINSPTFSGIASAVTPSQGTSTTQLATTAFVVQAIQNAVALLGSNTTAPLAPSLTSVNTLTAGRAAFTWASPTFNGGSAITSYNIYVDGVYYVEVSGSTLTYTGTLPPGSHSAYITAINAIGEGIPSNTIAFSVSIVVTVPGSPTGITAVSGNNSATVYFTPPTNNGNSAITGYIATSSGQSVVVSSGSSSPINFSSLPAGNYTFSVQAVNSAGAGSSSVPSATVAVTNPPITLPSPPTNISATGGVLQALVYFTPPTNTGNSPITRYIVTSSGTTVVTATGTTSPIAITGLQSGTYTFTVSSVNSAGTGPQSTASAAVVVTPAFTVPGAPVLSTPIAAGSNSETFNWVAPANNGGSPIVGYNIYVDGVLVAGSVTIPGAPTLGVPNVSTPTQATFAWTAPGNNGGSPITGYNVYVDGILQTSSITVPSAPSLGVPDSSIANEAIFHWTPPANNGGSPIVGYDVYVDGVLQTSSYSPPGAPNLSIPNVSLPNEAIFTWTAPTNTGGSPITGYNVIVDGVNQ